MICAGGFTLRWATVVTAALLAMVMATGCNVMGSDSGSVSGSGDDADEAGVDGEDILFDTLDNGQHNCKKRMRGCPEDARWCTSLGEVQSRDPEKCCNFPDCPN
ncbi:hypothetical protein PRIC1_006886 [Phytophthora ramorum]|uniref:Uncharacterized protein n=1 Tax=Phytophthora ramorum TaxID=164328 RepID=H3GY02_PHYRM|nr:hypothetical protein KRP23_14802 [Phytophthora ramorum]KAH7505635.1 hypothetical protein KRP22_3608 [Phytophthora ramorum]